jgi:hypothetical protein
MFKVLSSSAQLYIWAGTLVPFQQIEPQLNEKQSLNMGEIALLAEGYNER